MLPFGNSSTIAISCKRPLLRSNYEDNVMDPTCSKSILNHTKTLSTVGNSQNPVIVRCPNNKCMRLGYNHPHSAFQNDLQPHPQTPGLLNSIQQAPHNNTNNQTHDNLNISISPSNKGCDLSKANRQEQHESSKTFSQAQSSNQFDLFDESEIQNSILNLAKTGSSTLSIRIYHRCFGKGIGLYYPSMLVNTESKCIECFRCYKMMNPKEFVSHNHSKKETHVCHWGFIPENWRYYIKLSDKPKQVSNNLDEDELLIQFEKLQSIPESERDKLSGRSNEREPIGYYHYDQSKNDGYFPWRYFPPVSQEPAKQVVDGSTFLIQQSICPNTSLPSLIKPYDPNLSAMPPQCSWSYADCTRFITNFNTSSRTNIPFIPRQHSMRPGSSGALVASSAAGPTLQYDGLDTIRPKANAHDIQLQREIYLASNLAAYLNAVGLSEELVSNITQVTLAIVQKSRLLS